MRKTVTRRRRNLVQKSENREITPTRLPDYMKGRIVFIETDTPPPLKQIEIEEDEDHED
jgi:hypothetical protein